MIIYKITNTKNGKIYIGKTTTSVDIRWSLHLQHAFKENRQTRFCAALRKHGADSFVKEILIENVASAEELNGHEIRLIGELDSTNPLIGYNTSQGGDGGFTDEMRRKSAETRKKHGLTPEHKQALIEGRRRVGYLAKTEQQKVELSQSLKQYYQDHPDHHALICELNKQKAMKGMDHPMYGKTHTNEARAKMSRARSGRTYEEIYGNEQASELRHRLSQQVGSKNANYHDIDEQLLILVSNNPRLTRQELCAVLNCSGPTLSKRFRVLLLVNNMQRFRREKTNEELALFFKEKLNEFYQT